MSDGLKFITGYRYATEMLKLINGMTFLYNPNWESRQSSDLTFPIAFFHVKSMHEVMDSEVQTKKVIFYNSSNGSNFGTVNGGVTSVVADNIVNKPKTYKMEVIVPYDNLTCMFNTSYTNAYQQSAIIPAIDSESPTGSFVKSTQSLLSYTTSSLSLAKKAIDMILNTLNIVPSTLTNIPKYNKNSLEAMWRNRTILKMKMWDGWNFKYVAITGFDISKEATEEGVEEATLTLTEVPIMLMKPKSEALKDKKIAVINKYDSVVKGTAKVISAGF